MRRAVVNGRINQVRAARQRYEDEYLQSLRQNTSLGTREAIDRITVMHLPTFPMRNPAGGNPSGPYLWWRAYDAAWSRFKRYAIDNDVLVVSCSKTGNLPMGGTADVCDMAKSKSATKTRYIDIREWALCDPDAFLRGYDRICNEWVIIDGKVRYRSILAYCTSKNHANWIAKMASQKAIVSSYLWGIGIYGTDGPLDQYHDQTG